MLPLLFWNLLFIAFIAGAIWMGFGIIHGANSQACIEDFRVTDPQINALLFLRELQTQGLFDPTINNVEDFAWIYNGGELRIMVALDTGTYSGVACYTENSTSFQDIQPR